MANFVVHQSTLKCWRSCHRKYYYRYILRLEKRKPPAPLLRGTVVHQMIENHLEGKDPWKPYKEMVKAYSKLFDEEKENYGDLPTELKTLMTGYFEWYKKDPLFPISPKGSKKKAEHKFRVKLTESIDLEGMIDAVASDRAKRGWLVDHKSHKQIPRGDVKYSDIQSALYTWVIPQMGFAPVRGVAWNYIRWKAPAIPELLKSGEMTRRVNIDTTWPVYKQALLDNKLNPKNYKDMEKLLSGKEGDFYVRSYLPVKKEMIETLVDEARTTAREIKRKGGKDTTRSTNNQCGWCEYYGLCNAELRGLDTSFMLKAEYREKKEKDDEKESDEA